MKSKIAARDDLPSVRSILAGSTVLATILVAVGFLPMPVNSGWYWPWLLATGATVGASIAFGLILLMESSDSR